MRRRDFLPAAAGTGMLTRMAYAAEERPNAQKGRLKQGVTNGVFGKSQLSIEDKCRIASELGCTGFDLVGPKDWPTLKKYGLKPTMYPPPDGSTIPFGLNRKENHEKILASLRKGIDTAAEWGAPNVITFSGNRAGMSDQEGMDNCVAGLNAIKKYAEDKSAPQKLAQKVKTGGSGNWGPIPMPPNNVPDADLNALVGWVLGLK